MKKKLYPDSPVLIVDDEKPILQSTDFILHANGVTNVECCQQSVKVMTRLKKKKYSMILLDFNMPGISGEKLLPSIKKNYPGTPVVIVTGQTNQETRSFCSSHEADDFLEKPVDPSHLMDSVRLCMEGRESYQPIKKTGSDRP